mmetsp:Transcript_27244/g.58537  ORF Transcript_27244/g.58537 Transcript_27244/m.58537 type:complete len:211 (-) Transcript_27244:248-880(-)
MRASARSLLPLLVVAALLGSMCPPAIGFRAVPLIGIKQHITPIHNNPISRHNQHLHITINTTLLLSSPDDDIPNEKSQEREKMSGQVPPADISQKRMDPLFASLTRIDEPTFTDETTRPVPLFGEVTVSGDLIVLLPAAVISILGLIFSIVVAFNSGDAFVEESSQVELTEMKNAPTVVVEEGRCRGLCSSQDEDLDGLRSFMGSFSKKD